MVHPADLPDVQDAGPGYGPVQTIVFFAVYAILIVAAVIYLLRKLPRGGRHGPPHEDEDGQSP